MPTAPQEKKKYDFKLNIDTTKVGPDVNKGVYDGALKAYRLSETQTGKPMLNIDIKITKAYDDANEGGIGEILSDTIFLMDDEGIDELEDDNQKRGAQIGKQNFVRLLKALDFKPEELPTEWDQEALESTFDAAIDREMRFRYGKRVDKNGEERPTFQYGVPAPGGNGTTAAATAAVPTGKKPKAKKN